MRTLVRLIRKPVPTTSTVTPAVEIATDPGAGHPKHCRCRQYHN